MRPQRTTELVPELSNGRRYIRLTPQSSGRRILRLAGALGLFLIAMPALAGPLSSGFTYQGKLKQAGQPANGSFTMDFRLFDAATNGQQLGTSVLSSVSITDGLFSVNLNESNEFGSSALDGNARWLAIAVNGSPLSPRQPILAAPYALQAVRALSVQGIDGHSLDAADGSPVDALFVDSDGRTGIGTTAPKLKLHVWESGDLSAGIGINTTTNKASYLDFEGNGESYWQVGRGGSTNDFGISRTFIGEALRIKSDTLRVGINTVSPATTLDVNGSSRTTTLEITGGSENLQGIVAWGDADFGATTVPPGTYKAMCAGHYHALAIRQDGTLVAWGSNSLGSTLVPGGTFTHVAAGYEHSLAIRTDGTIAAMGDNFHGQTNAPAGTFIAIAGGAWHSLAIRSDGTLATWGEGCCGLSDIPAGTFSAIAAGDFFSVGLRADGTIATWGDIDPAPAGTYTAISAKSSHALALRTDGTIAAWGRSDGGLTNIPNGSFIAIAAGVRHNLALRADGTVVGWGLNQKGQVTIPSGHYSAIAAGGDFSLGLNQDATPEPGLRLLVDSAFKPGSDRWTIYSDRRLKKDIHPLASALDKMLQLHGVSFAWEDPASMGGLTRPQMGLIADEVQQVFPEWVGRDQHGFKTLTVTGFEGLTAEAMRDLRAEKDRQFESLRAEKDRQLESLRAEKDVEIADLKSRLERIEKLLPSSAGTAK